MEDPKIEAIYQKLRAVEKPPGEEWYTKGKMVRWDDGLSEEEKELLKKHVEEQSAEYNKRKEEEEEKKETARRSIEGYRSLFDGGSYKQRVFDSWLDFNGCFYTIEKRDHSAILVQFFDNMDKEMARGRFEQNTFTLEDDVQLLFYQYYDDDDDRIMLHNANGPAVVNKMTGECQYWYEGTKLPAEMIKAFAEKMK